MDIPIGPASFDLSISLGTVLTVITILAALAGFERFVWRKGREKGLAEGTANLTKHDIDDLRGDIKNMNDAQQKYNNENDKAHDKLEGKVDSLTRQFTKMQIIITKIAAKVDPNIEIDF